MRKMSQTEELAKILAARARRHTLTPEQVSRGMDEQDYDVAGLDALYAELEARGIRAVFFAIILLATKTVRKHPQLFLHLPQWQQQWSQYQQVRHHIFQ